MPSLSSSSRSGGWLAPVLLLAGCSFLVGTWVLLALYMNRQCGWMALVVALDAAVMLRIGGMAGGWKRALWALAATVAVTAVANWGIAVLQMGAAMGAQPWESARKMGSGFALTLLSLANRPADYLWMAVAAVAAVWSAR